MGQLIHLQIQYWAGWVRQVADGWMRFWMTPADPLPLGILRLLVGGILTYSLCVWGLRLESMLGPDGWHSESMMSLLLEDTYAWSLWWLVPQDWMWPAHYASVAIAAAFTLGICTPITKWLAFAVSVSYAARAPLANYGMDQILCTSMLYLMIGPCGDAFSFDRWRARVRHAKAKLLLGMSPEKLAPRRSIRANTALRMMQVQLCIIYLFAGASKLQGEAWWTGNAMWQAFANLEYQSLDMAWLAFHPIVLALLTHATIVWELAFPFLVWPRLTRPLILIGGVGVHFGIGLMMGMWTFGLLMMFTYVVFLEAETLRSAWGACFDRGRLLQRVMYDPADLDSVRRAAAVHARWFGRPPEFVALTPEGAEVLAAADSEQAAPATSEPNRIASIPLNGHAS